MKLLDAGWESDLGYNETFTIPETSVKEKYKTDLRTVVGTIEAIKDNVLEIDVGKSKEHYTVDEKSKWTFAEGDNVRLDCVITEDESVWNPTVGLFGEIVEIKSIMPNCIKNEIGKVTATFDDYAIFDDSVILNYSKTIKKDEINLWDTFEYEAIETSISCDGRYFSWRIIRLVKKILNKNDRRIDNYKNLELNDEYFELKQDIRYVTKFVTLFNKSKEKLTVVNSKITSNTGFIECQKPRKKYEFSRLTSTKHSTSG